MSDLPEPNRTPVESEGSGALPQLSRRGWILAIAGVLALVAAVSVYAVASNQAEPVRFRDVGFSVVDQHEITATFDVFLYADGVASCTVRALNSSYGEVGVVTVDVDSVDGSEQRIDTSIATTEEAVTASVHSCTFAPSADG
ncbi:DUF4307 domain-containing protein [Demequina zhanjiangensis]|uniref:DUF4307 domain-containing protein n=1 Tax=Demequina zhanjiangensis TaxID=3051659 RepID=A0ABT8G4V5_9MICO|nr:DUF4307 domain-containing protein [Demequina sp. SYSU T00b26]MDN4474087.1 DUF4307 domain-containing protein [Demequina sp. SYSU T00b26]